VASEAVVARLRCRKAGMSDAKKYLSIFSTSVDAVGFKTNGNKGRVGLVRNEELPPRRTRMYINRTYPRERRRPNLVASLLPFSHVARVA
jgi:hypothetical protein